MATSLRKVTYPDIGLDLVSRYFAQVGFTVLENQFDVGLLSVIVPVPDEGTLSALNVSNIGSALNTRGKTALFVNAR